MTGIEDRAKTKAIKALLERDEDSFARQFNRWFKQRWKQR